MAEWLESDASIDDFVTRMPSLASQVKDYFKRFVDATSDYHNDASNELTLRATAYAHGMSLWMYEYFLTKFKIDREPGEEGRQQVEILKKHPFYIN